MVDDARKATKTFLDTYLTAANIKCDNGITQSPFITCYEQSGEYPAIEVFYTMNKDIVFAIGVPESRGLYGHDMTPYGYEEDVPITIYVAPKTGVTPAKVKWSAEAELRRICETNPYGSLRRLTRVTDVSVDLGGFVLEGVKYIMNYRRDTS